MSIKVCVLGCLIGLAGCRSPQADLGVTDSDVRELDEFRAENPKIAESVEVAAERRAKLARFSTPSRSGFGSSATGSPGARNYSCRSG